MEEKDIRLICLYRETCLDYKQGKRKCEDCIHNKEYWTEVQLRDMAQNIRRLHKENAELKAENEKLYEEKDCLHKIIDRLLENAGYSKDIASAEDFEDVYENMQYKNNKLEEYK